MEDHLVLRKCESFPLPVEFADAFKIFVDKCKEVYLEEFMKERGHELEGMQKVQVSVYIREDNKSIKCSLTTTDKEGNKGSLYGIPKFENESHLYR